jgi:hypothetical protein
LAAHRSPWNDISKILEKWCGSEDGYTASNEALFKLVDHIFVEVAHVEQRIHPEHFLLAFPQISS